MNQTIVFKGKEIHPYESFYHDVTENFNHGEIGGGISRCVKTTASLATMEEIQIATMRGRNPQIIQLGNIVDDTNKGFKNPTNRKSVQ